MFPPHNSLRLLPLFRSFRLPIHPPIPLHQLRPRTLEHPPWWWSSIVPPTTALPHHTQLNPSITSSGKSTFLSLLTGDYPQSYTQALPSLSPATSSSPSSSITQATKTHTNSSVVSEIFDAFPHRHAGTTVWKAVVIGFGGGFCSLGGSERVGEIPVGDDELGKSRLRWETNRLRWRGRRTRGGGKCKSGRSLRAGRSSSPLAHEPGPRQELRRWKKNAQHVGSHLSHRANSV